MTASKETWTSVLKCQGTPSLAFARCSGAAVFLRCVARAEQLLSKSFLHYQAALFLVLWIEKEGFILVYLFIYLFVCGYCYIWAAASFFSKSGTRSKKKIQQVSFTWSLKTEVPSWSTSFNAPFPIFLGMFYIQCLGLSVPSSAEGIVMFSRKSTSTPFSHKDGLKNIFSQLPYSKAEIVQDKVK